MKRPRLKKWAKWACTLAAGVSLALALFSRFCSCGYGATSNHGRTFWFAGVDGGLLSAVEVDLSGSVNRSTGGEWKVARAAPWRWGCEDEASPSGWWWSWYAGLHFATDPQ